jgi:hypothetical protein
MKKIGTALVSDDIKDVSFVCKLSACHGNCCVDGDAGAPLEEEEIAILEDYIEEIKPYMTKEGREVIELMGVFDYDADSSYVTPLVNHRECAFVYVENDINFCAIEKAYLEGKIKFQKPVSCHLYPIRLKQIGDFTGVNYDQWSICKPARINGKELGVPLYEFLKNPLIRKFGKDWYDQLVEEFEKEE